MTDPACGRCNDQSKFPGRGIIKGCTVHDLDYPLARWIKHKILDHYPTGEVKTTEVDSAVWLPVSHFSISSPPKEDGYIFTNSTWAWHYKTIPNPKYPN